MEKQVYYIQVLLVNKIERCWDKGNKWVETHIKEIYEAYQELPQETHQPININKEKQKEGVVQDEEVLLYKPYNISSEDSWPKMPEPMFIQEEVNNLGKALKTFQALVKTILFYLLP